jgi:hypothetical protein
VDDLTICLQPDLVTTRFGYSSYGMESEMHSATMGSERVALGEDQGNWCGVTIGWENLMTTGEWHMSK